jgi:predicted transcriptional regulator
MKSECPQKGSTPISKNSISRIAKTLNVSEQTVRSYFNTNNEIGQIAYEKHKNLNSPTQ